MKKIVIGVMCLAMLGMCGCEKDADVPQTSDIKESSITGTVEGKNETSPDGLYIETENLYLNSNFDFNSKSLDEYLSSVPQAENAKQIFLGNGSFRITEYDNMYSTEYEGEYEIADGKIEFEYEKFTSDSTGEVLSVGIDEKDVSRAEYAPIEQMKSMNETNGYAFTVKGANCASSMSDRLYPDNLAQLPMFSSFRTTFEKPYTLFTDGRIIYTETYGAELADSYTIGEPFEISYNYMEYYTTDEFSRYSTAPEGQKEQLLEHVQISLGDIYGVAYSDVSDSETSIKFSNGEWVWYNKDSAVINNGRYQESPLYGGMIVMYVTDESKVSDFDGKAELNKQGMFFCIRDNRICYPAFIKTE